MLKSMRMCWAAVQWQPPSGDLMPHTEAVRSRLRVRSVLQFLAEKQGQRVFFYFRFIFSLKLCICVFVAHKCSYSVQLRRQHWIPHSWSYRKLWKPPNMSLATELQSSTRAEGTLYCWAICPAQIALSKRKKSLASHSFPLYFYVYFAGFACMCVKVQLYAVPW